MAVAGELPWLQQNLLQLLRRVVQIYNWQQAEQTSTKISSADFKETFILFGKNVKLPPKGRWWSSLCGAEQGGGRGVLDEELLDRAGGELGSGTSYRL